MRGKKREKIGLILIGCLLISVVFLSGCTERIVFPPTYFNDTGSEIENFEVCYEMGISYFIENYGLSREEIIEHMSLPEIICEEGLCVCK